MSTTDKPLDPFPFHVLSTAISPTGPVIPPPFIRKPTELELYEAIEKAKSFLWEERHVDGHWCGELESNARTTAEYVFLFTALKLPISQQKKTRLFQYFFSSQRSCGAWSLASSLLSPKPRDTAGDISITAEVYLALILLGASKDDPRLLKAQDFILEKGGLEAIDIFASIHLTLFGLIPWGSIPNIPAELILLPRQSPINIYRLSGWIRPVLVPWLIIVHHRPVYQSDLLDSNSLDHLWLESKNKTQSPLSPWIESLMVNGVGWKSFFGATNTFVKIMDSTILGGFSKTVAEFTGLNGKISEKFSEFNLRQHSLKKCEKWVLNHQEKDGSWAGLTPSTHASLLALALQGHSHESDHINRGVQAIEDFAINNLNGFRLQLTHTPIVDTALSCTAILESGHNPKDPDINKSVSWLKSKQLLTEVGDWKTTSPPAPTSFNHLGYPLRGNTGGWPAQYFNKHYPDLGATADVLCALLNHSPENSKSAATFNAFQWILTMQNRDGGWAAFDRNSDRISFKNNSPLEAEGYSDSSCPKITGKIIEAFGLLFSIAPRERVRYQPLVDFAIQYLRNVQAKNGAWLDNWGTPSLHATSNVLFGLSKLKMPQNDPAIGDALTWISTFQNLDYGWGIELQSTSLQTAWAVLGLLSYLSPKSRPVTSGVRWLLNNQSGKSWEDFDFSGAGIPCFQYVRHQYYPHYFPLLALSRYYRAISC